MSTSSQAVTASFAINRFMTYRDRAIRVGGYFTAALLLMNVFLSGTAPMTAVMISLLAGFAFTGASLAFGERCNLK